MHFVPNHFVPSAVRRLPPQRRVTVEIWHRVGNQRSMVNKCVLCAPNRTDAVTKQATAMGLSRSQWNGSNPEYVLRAY